MEKKVGHKLKMIQAVNQALKMSRGDNEKTLKQLASIISEEKDNKTEIAMIAAASKALSLKERTKLSDREIISRIVPELNEILENID